MNDANPKEPDPRDPSFLQFLLAALRQRSMDPEPPQRSHVRPPTLSGGVRG